MHLVDKDTPLTAPGVCFICEGEPFRERGEPVVDTEHVYSPLGATNLRGRKYLCVRCIAEASALLDTKAPETKAKVKSA